MIEDPQSLVWFALGVTVVFVVFVFVALGMGRRTRRRAVVDIHAADVRARTGFAPSPDANLFYGLWLTSTHEVRLVVRDGHDVEVGTVIHRVFSTSITVGERTYAVARTPGKSERAELVDPTGESSCAFESRGWFGNQVGRYAIAGDGTLSIAARWNWPWRQGTLPISNDSRVVGRFASLNGGGFDQGRVVLVPASVPVEVALLMMWKGAGRRPR